MKTWTMATALLLCFAQTALGDPPKTKYKLQHPLKQEVRLNCDTYIESGRWEYMFVKDNDPVKNYQFNEWRLTIKPTECGRYIDPTETPNMFYEIIKKFGQNVHWTNNRGMINQLTCHLYLARENLEWHLEPWRPYVGYTATVNAGCNPIVPDPDPEYH